MRLRHLSLLVTTVALLFAACRGNTATTPTPTSAALTVTVDPSALTPTPTVAVEPTKSLALEALLVPGPTAPAPSTIFFGNGNDLWTLAADGSAARVTENLSIGPWTQTVDGACAAVVIYRDADGRRTEEIRPITSDGQLGEPIYGPVATTGAAGTPAIQALDWSWARRALAVVFADESIMSLWFTDDQCRTQPFTKEIVAPQDADDVSVVAWAPSGNGIAYLAHAERGKLLYVTPNDDVARPVTNPEREPVRSVRTFEWLPGRGRIAFIEDAAAPVVRSPSSIFTIAPDGSVLELLVSAGQFAPAASIYLLSASPDGVDLAFTVCVPDEQGRPSFQSLWILNIDSRELRQVPVDRGYRVTDLWWTSAGLLWRGVDVNAPAPVDTLTYSGSEPFVLGRFDPAAGTSSIVFHSAK